MLDIDGLTRAATAFVADHVHLSAVARRAAVVLHGSLTMGIEDAYADVDVWVLVPSRADAADVVTAAGTGFFDFTFAGRPGHFNVAAVDAFADRVGRADLPLVADLRRAVPLVDPTGDAARLVGRAREPMSDATRRRLACYHYVEMRSEHRSADNPINRNDAVATLLAVSKTLGHALRMACVLDGEPYPYDKWLAHAARQMPAGRAVLPLVDRAVTAIERGALSVGGPESSNPLNVILREVRSTLVALATERQVTGRWLDKWWLHLDELRAAVKNVAWP